MRTLGLLLHQSQGRQSQYSKSILHKIWNGGFCTTEVDKANRARINKCNPFSQLVVVSPDAEMDCGLRRCSLFHSSNKCRHRHWNSLEVSALLLIARLPLSRWNTTPALWGRTRGTGARGLGGGGWGPLTKNGRGRGSDGRGPVAQPLTPVSYQEILVHATH